MVKVRVRNETGKIYFDVSYGGKRCKELTLLTNNPANMKRAEDLANQINADIAKGQFNFPAYFPHSRHKGLFGQAPSSDQGDAVGPDEGRSVSNIRSPTFRQFAESWTREMTPGWRQGTRDWMKSIIDIHLIPVFGARPVSSIKRHDLLEFRANLCDPSVKKRRKLSNKTINTVMRVLRAILAEASDRYEFKNPGGNVKRLKVARKEIVPFTMDEVQLILRRVRSDFRPYMTVAFFTGMRPGELNGLKWSCINLDRKVIRVRETYSRGRTDTTKTEGSQREIHISQPVIAALIEQQKVTGAKGSYVFCMPNGAPVYDRNYTQRVWEPLLRNLGLTRRVPYQTRHTCATLWMAAGENPGWIARQLGHETTEMLFRVYSRWAPNVIGRDGSAFDRVLQQSGISGPSPANDPVTDSALPRAADR